MLHGLLYIYCSNPGISMTTIPTDALWVLLLHKALTVFLMGKPLCWFPQTIFGVRNYLLWYFTKNMEREYIALKHVKLPKSWDIWVQKQMQEFMVMSVLSCSFLLSYGRSLRIDWFGPRLAPGNPNWSSRCIMVQTGIRKGIPSPSTVAELLTSHIPICPFIYDERSVESCSSFVPWDWRLSEVSVSPLVPLLGQWPRALLKTRPESFKWLSPQNPIFFLLFFLK